MPRGHSHNTTCLSLVTLITIQFYLYSIVIWSMPSPSLVHWAPQGREPYLLYWSIQFQNNQSLNQNFWINKGKNPLFMAVQVCVCIHVCLRVYVYEQNFSVCVHVGQQKRCWLWSSSSTKMDPTSPFQPSSPLLPFPPFPSPLGTAQHS